MGVCLVVWIVNWSTPSTLRAISDDLCFANWSGSVSSIHSEYITHTDTNPLSSSLCFANRSRWVQSIHCRLSHCVQMDLSPSSTKEALWIAKCSTLHVTVAGAKDDDDNDADGDDFSHLLLVFAALSLHSVRLGCVFRCSFCCRWARLGTEPGKNFLFLSHCSFNPHGPLSPLFHHHSNFSCAHLPPRSLLWLLEYLSWLLARLLAGVWPPAPCSLYV